MFSKKVAGVLAGIAFIVAVSEAFGVTDLRFWASRSDVQEVAENTYTNSISIKSDLKIRVEDQLAQCKLERRDCSFLRQTLERLSREISQLEQNLLQRR